MEQYLSIKKKYPDAVLFFRMGDFYEMFYDDARVASEVLGLTLTSRAHGKAANVPLAGFPHHSVDQYLSRMLNAGYRVAICEQVEDPKKAKGIVKRAVLEVITPGTATSDNVIEGSANNYLLSLVVHEDRLGMAGIDVSTGEFFLTEGDSGSVVAQAQSFNPREILVPVEQGEIIKPLIKWAQKPLFTPVEDYYFSHEYAYNTLVEHFNTVSLKGFGCEEYHTGISAAGAALKYLQSIQGGKLGHVQKLSVLNLSNYMILDNVTRRNLEILAPINENNPQGCLLSVLDRTVTRMGARLLKSWLIMPLLDKNTIQKRHQAVGELRDDFNRRDAFISIFKNVNDIERITSKINANRANGRDVRGLCESLKLIPDIIQNLQGGEAQLLCEFRDKMQPLEDLTAEIDKTLVDDPPVAVTEGGLIRDGYDPELDELRKLSRSGKQWIRELQEEERKRTGIPSLRINYNRVFGYYIEVTKTHLSKVPPHYIRKQTLVNAERFITPEMKEHEEQILNAEESIVQKEQELFQKLRARIAEETASLQNNARIIAHLDVLCSFAQIAQENDYCKPKITDGSDLVLIESRHPVVEKLLPPGEPFIPNDHSMSPPEEQIHVITGPNMAGKSTFLRQVGLCVLMAQVGSFVPARKAEIGIVDRIFTRVGAHDDVTRGESTFLVEMIELANIINNATPRSILLLDEIGRGTSTFDGLSIAWATVEYLHNTPRIAAKTLFATHFHEVTAIIQYLPNVRNFHIQVKEWEDSVIFLRKILPGSTDHSYGIHVARMAGVPPAIIIRAREILDNLEAMGLAPEHFSAQDTAKSGFLQGSGAYQISLFSQEETILRQSLQSIDPETITPREAIQKLFELKRILLGKDQSGSNTKQ